MTNVSKKYLVYFYKVILIFMATQEARSESCGNQCTSKQCALTGSIISSNMDDSVNPCEDFYSYACKGYQTEKVIPENRIFINAFTSLEEDLLNKLRIILESEAEDEKSLLEQLPRQFYTACMNTTAIDDVGLNPLTDQINYLGGWPVLFGNLWREETFSWENTYLLMRRAGLHYDSIFNFHVGPDMNVAGHKVVYLDQPTFGLDRVHLIKGLGNKQVEAYLEYMYNVAKLLAPESETMKQELIETLKFEISLAKISPSGSHRRHMNDNVYNPMIVGEFQQAHPRVPWMFLLNGILHPYHVLTDYEYINVQAPTYFTDLMPLLDDTPKRVIANYIIWRAIQSSIPFLPESIRSLERDYGYKITGRKEYNSKWIECTEHVKKGYPLAMGVLYVRKYFDRRAKMNAMKILGDIKNEIKRIVETSEWMDKSSRNIASEKIDSISLDHVGFPEQILNDNQVNLFYYPLSLFNMTGYFNSVLAVNFFAADEEIKELREKVDKNNLNDIGEVADIKAYYSLVDNNLHVPAGLLQGIFFSLSHLYYINYATIGFIMAHEIVHAFDDWGRHVNKDGVKGDWWGEQTNTNYQMKSKCFVEQYSNYSVAETGDMIDGERTLKENIADNMAMKVAYAVFNNYVSATFTRDNTLPGLDDIKADKTFWLAAASVWCSKARPEYTKLAVTTDYRSIHKYRVNGPIANHKHFGSTFSCPSGSKMNPVNKCELW